MLKLTHFKPHNLDATDIATTIPLTAEERSRSRYQFTLTDGQIICLHLPRGTILKDGDILTDETQSSLVQIIAKPEPVLTILSHSPLLLLRAAYHLGNRHIPVELTLDYLRLSPDTVLKGMLAQLGLEIKEEITPFYPETGAYGHP
jgi:urease accessory protein